MKTGHNMTGDRPKDAVFIFLDFLCLTLFSELREKFNVTVIPKLIIVNCNGEVITTRGRKELTDRGVGAFRTWSSGSSGSQLHMEPSTNFNEQATAPEEMLEEKNKIDTQ